MPTHPNASKQQQFGILCRILKQSLVLDFRSLFVLLSLFLKTNNAMISGFLRGLNEIFIILGRYTAPVTSQKNEDFKNDAHYE